MVSLGTRYGAYYWGGPWSGPGYSYAGWNENDYASRYGTGCLPGTIVCVDKTVKKRNWAGGRPSKKRLSTGFPAPHTRIIRT